MAQSDSFGIDRTQRHIGPIWLSPGITPINVLTLFYSGMMTIIFITTTGLLQPYLLHEHLRMPTDVQGDFTGNLGVITEMVAIAVVVAAGVSSDRVGRGGIFVGGFLLIAIGFILLPLTRDPLTFIALRVITAAGFSMCLMMLASVIADYPQNASRGKLISINSVITGIGVVLIASLIFAQLPEFYASQGAEPIAAGTYTFWLIAGVALIAAFITFIGIKESQATAEKKREPFVQLLRTGFGEVRKNPRLGLTCAAYFVSRSDLAVFVMFFPPMDRGGGYRSRNDSRKCTKHRRSTLWGFTTGHAFVRTGDGAYC